jgi:hypothetical protein
VYARLFAVARHGMAALRRFLSVWWRMGRPAVRDVLLVARPLCACTAEHHAGWLYILTNARPGKPADAVYGMTEPQPGRCQEGAIGKELQLLVTPASHTSLSHWKPVLEPGQEVVLCDMDMLR